MEKMEKKSEDAACSIKKGLEEIVSWFEPVEQIVDMWHRGTEFMTAQAAHPGVAAGRGDEELAAAVSAVQTIHNKKPQEVTLELSQSNRSGQISTPSATLRDTSVDAELLASLREDVKQLKLQLGTKKAPPTPGVATVDSLLEGFTGPLAKNKIKDLEAWVNETSCVHLKCWMGERCRRWG